MAARTDNEIRELTPEQGQQTLDDKARQYLGI
jgi:ribosomal protein L29